jgi:hypothetical protein
MGWGLWTFRDCPDAFEELMGVSCSFVLLDWYFGFYSIIRPLDFLPLSATQTPLTTIVLSNLQEIAEAKNDLRAKGVTVD